MDGREGKRRGGGVIARGKSPREASRPDKGSSVYDDLYLHGLQLGKGQRSFGQYNRLTLMRDVTFHIALVNHRGQETFSLLNVVLNARDLKGFMELRDRDT